MPIQCLNLKSTYFIECNWIISIGIFLLDRGTLLQDKAPYIKNTYVYNWRKGQ